MKIKTGKYYSQWGFGVSFIKYTKGMWSIVVDLGPYYIDFYNMNGNKGDNLKAFNEFYKNIEDDFGPAPVCDKCGKESESWDDLVHNIDSATQWELWCYECVDMKNKINNEQDSMKIKTKTSSRVNKNKGKTSSRVNKNKTNEKS